MFIFQVILILAVVVIIGYVARGALKKIIEEYKDILKLK